MYYRHDLNYVYPERSDEHMISVKHLRDTNFDENYKYLPKGFIHKITRGALWIALNLVGFPVVTLRHGLKIYGKENLKKNKNRCHCFIAPVLFYLIYPVKNNYYLLPGFVIRAAVAPPAAVPRAKPPKITL